jgi:hypothetical protein
MRDFDGYPRSFSPQVVEAKVLRGQGDHLEATMRVRQRHVVTVVMDTAYDIVFGRLDARHGYSISRSTRIAEIEGAGTSDERALNSSQEHGFSVAAEHLLELRGAGRRPHHADRIGFAYALHSNRSGLGGWAVCGERSAGVAGIHAVALSVQCAAQMIPARQVPDRGESRYQKGKRG